jgi:hypothetical protein
MTGGANQTGGSTQGAGMGSLNTAVSPANIAALTQGATGASPMAGMSMASPNQAAYQMGQSMPGGTASYISNALNGGSGAPQWMKGLQLGQQMAQMGQQPQGGGMAHPMMPQRPMGGMPQGMGGGAVPTGAVPGSGQMMPQPPQMPQGLMGGAPPSAGMVGQQGGGQINPALLQMLLRSRGGAQ